ncbi:MAG TPA: recombinase family protein, partial [Methanoregulaceae archaeon]|nr:recombinase family protein [Methanoregulaceae archaeon]
MTKYSNKQLVGKFGDLVDVLMYLEERAKKLRTQPRSDGAIIYVRVSTQDQVDTNSLADQKRESLRRIEEKGIPFINDAFFSDEGVSGRRLDRPGFKKAIEYAILNADKVSHFMVYCSDRFARKQIFSALTRTFLKGLGITVCSVTDKMEEMSETQLAMKEAQNEEYALQGIERTKRGMKTARENGDYTSNPPYGHVKGSPRQVPGTTDFRRDTVEDPELFPYAQLIWKLALQGYRMFTIRDMAAAQGAPMRYRRDKPIDKDTVHRILTNRFYAGLVRIEGENWIPGNHRAIVTEAEFEQVQRSLDFANSPQAVPHISDRDEFPLRRFVRCENCGSGITGSPSTNGYVRKHESQNHEREPKKYGNYRCWRNGCVNITADLLHDRFIEQLNRHVPPKAVLVLLERAIRWVMKEQIASTGTMRERVQSDVRKTKLDLAGIAQKMASGVISEEAYKMLEEELMKRIQDLEARAHKLANLDKITEKDVKKALGMIQRASVLWPRLDLESQMALQSALFPNGITISREGELSPIETPLMRVCRLMEPTSAGIQTAQSTWNRNEHGLTTSVSSTSVAGSGGKSHHGASTEKQSLGTIQVACESTTSDVSESDEENLVPQARLERTTCGLGPRR